MNYHCVSELTFCYFLFINLLLDKWSLCFFFTFFFLYIHTSKLQKRKRLYKTQYPTIEHQYLPQYCIKNIKNTKHKQNRQKKRIKMRTKTWKKCLHEWSIKSLGWFEEYNSNFKYRGIRLYTISFIAISERCAIEPIILSVRTFRICV